MKLIPHFLKFNSRDLEVYKQQDYQLIVVSDQRKLNTNELKEKKNMSSNKFINR